MRAEGTDLLVVGAGPAGLAAAEAVRRAGWRVIALDRESAAGGVPRHCLHPGFGLRDLHRASSGPGYASARVERAAAAGADIRTGWSVTGWAGPTSLLTTSRQGLTRIDAGAVLLATGCRERPRPARLVPGSRPAGVLTTGALQQFVHLHGQRAGTRAVVVGVEHIAFSAAHSLAASGTSVAAVVSESPVPQTFRQPPKTGARPLSPSRESSKNGVSSSRMMAGDEGALFRIANKFAIRHRNEQQLDDYPDSSAARSRTANR